MANDCRSIKLYRTIKIRFFMQPGLRNLRFLKSFIGKKMSLDYYRKTKDIHLFYSLEIRMWGEMLLSLIRMGFFYKIWFGD